MNAPKPFSISGKHVTVAGLGHFGGGIEVTQWLVAQGARVIVTDMAPAEKLKDSVAQLEGLPIEFRLGEHRESDFTNTDLVVSSPAIPPSNEFLKAAERAGVPITTEIRLFIERCSCRIIGVTGTKGKSTTTSMLGELLKTKYTTWVGGNLGGSLLHRLPEMSSNDLVVLELSSYMLEHLRSLKWSPHVAVVTMLAEDHLEWHGSREAYIDSKKNIVRFQNSSDIAVLNRDDATAQQFARQTKAQVAWFGAQDQPFELSLIGVHNQLNAQGAYGAAAVMGVVREAASGVLRNFKGLSHRLQVVFERDGVKYVNDSIATIPQAAIAACDAFPEGKVIQIIGGYDKHLEMRGMCEHLARRCKAVLTIGALGPELARMVCETASGRAAVHECENLSRAVATAQEISGSGDVVLLSTGCASYDQFANFEARGDEFTRLVTDSR